MTPIQWSTHVLLRGGGGGGWGGGGGGGMSHVDFKKW